MMNQTATAATMQDTATKAAIAKAIDKANKKAAAKVEPKDTTTKPAKSEQPKEAPTAKKTPTTTAGTIPIKAPDILVTLREVAEEAAHALSVALSSDSVALINKAREVATNAASKYNDALVKRQFDRFLTADNPMLAMVEAGFYKRLTVQVANTNAGQVARTNEKDTVFNVGAFIRHAGKTNVVNSSLWRPLLEKMACLLSIRATDDIGGDTSAMLEEFAMSEQARGMLHKEVKPRAQNPISNGTLLSGLQEVFDALLFVPVEGKEHNAHHLNSHDLHYTLYTCFQKGKGKATLSMPTFETLAARFVEVMHVRVKGLRYGAEYKTIERKEVAA